MPEVVIAAAGAAMWAGDACQRLSLAAGQRSNPQTERKLTLDVFGKHSPKHMATSCGAAQQLVAACRQRTVVLCVFTQNLSLHSMIH
jgi:hypothetical protein